MGFTCPDCTTAGSLRITSGIELAPDTRSDEIMLQVITCGKCNFTGLAVYEEARRGPLTSETYDHAGYRVAGTDLVDVIEWIEACPEPTNHRCQCVVHREMNRKDENGYWSGRAILRRYDSFPLELS